MQHELTLVVQFQGSEDESPQQIQQRIEAAVKTIAPKAVIAASVLFPGQPAT